MSTSTKAPATASRRDRGFTLIEILIAIVLVGILAAVVIIGIASLTEKGNQSACTASLDAAKAAAIVHYANNDAYPATIEVMVDDGELELPSGASVNGLVVDGGDWTLTMTASVGGKPPTFACT
jgi:prepilin-type N-terminal cleavage/methylation domain-containing protein